MLYRPDLQTVLVDGLRAAAPEAIRLGARCVGLRQTGSMVTVELADGETVEGDALIGADGVHSVVRRLLFGADAPRFSDAWRGAGWFRQRACPRRLPSRSASTGSAQAAM